MLFYQLCVCLENLCITLFMEDIASVLCSSITISQVSFVLSQGRENAWGRLDCPLSYKECNRWLQWITAFIEENWLSALLNIRDINVKCTDTQFWHTNWMLGAQEVDRIEEMSYERGVFSFEVGKSLLQIHRRVINLNSSQQYGLD